MQSTMNKINARDLKPGDRILAGADHATVTAVSYCNGENGESPKLFAPINQSTKTVAALRIDLEGRGPAYVHPARQIDALLEPLNFVKIAGLAVLSIAGTMGLVAVVALWQS